MYISRTGMWVSTNVYFWPLGGPGGQIGGPSIDIEISVKRWRYSKTIHLGVLRSHLSAFTWRIFTSKLSPKSSNHVVPTIVTNASKWWIHIKVFRQENLFGTSEALVPQFLGFYCTRCNGMVRAPVCDIYDKTRKATNCRTQAADVPEKFLSSRQI